MVTNPNAAALVIIALALTACGSTEPTAEDRLIVAATVSPIVNLVANVACESALVTGLVPEGSNSHTYQPSPSTVRVLADADVVFVNGLNLERPVIELAGSVMDHEATLVSLGDTALAPDDYIYDFSFPRSGGDPNPHLWTNPLLAIEYVELIEKALGEADPDSATRFRDNAENLIIQIETLDRALRKASATIPIEQRLLLTYHDSFPYFARDYNWTVIGAIQPSDFAQPSPGDVADLIDQIRETGVEAIFGSEVFPSPVLEQISRETGADFIDALRDDDLPGDPGDVNHSYLGLMTFDFITIVEALGGDAAALKGIPTGNTCSVGTYLD